MKSKNKIAWLIIAGLLLTSVIVNSFKSNNISDPSSKSSFWGGIVGQDTFSERYIEGEGSEKIAVIKVSGIITDSGSDSTPLLYGSSGTSVNNILKQLQLIEDDNAVKGVILEIDSPGGTVVAGQTLLAEIEKFKNRTNKKIVSVMRETAASAGYMISLPSDRIFANSASQTGSIGVIMQLADYQSLYEKIGVKPIIIKSGKMKDIGSSARDMTEEERAVLQSMIDESYNEFTSAVAKWRHLDQNQVANVSDGRVYSGKQAKENNLIDELGNFSDALNYLKDQLDLSSAMVIEYQAGTFDNIFNTIFQKIAFGGSIEEILIKNKANNKLMYLWVP